MTEQIVGFEIKSKIEHKTISEKENEIHYYLSGERGNPVILFLHPAFSDHTSFYKQIDYFSQEFQVITVDLIGHGLSKLNNSKLKIDASVECILKIMETENIDKIHISGVSMGGLIAQYFALQYPTQVLSLTTLGGYNINRVNREVVRLQRKEMFGWLFRIIFSMTAFRRYVASVSVINEEGLDHFYKSTKGFSRKSFTVMSGLNNLIAERENPLRNYPLLILAGEKDIDLSKKMAESWHNEEPDSIFHIIENAGHCANIDNYESFNAIVYSTIANAKKR